MTERNVNYRKWCFWPPENVDRYEQINRSYQNLPISGIPRAAAWHCYCIFFSHIFPIGVKIPSNVYRVKGQEAPP